MTYPGPEGPLGVLGITCAELGRYTHFTRSLEHLLLPKGSSVTWAICPVVGEACNRLVRDFLEEKEPEPDWLCLMGDDHKFEPDFLVKLLNRMYALDLDVIAPVCLRRSYPFEPVLYTGQDEQGKFQRLELVAEGGLHEVYAAGTAGMIVRRRVLAALSDPWFPHDTLPSVGQASEDLAFCAAVREAGYTIYADLDVVLGHMTPVCLWPSRAGGEWGVGFEYGDGGRWVARRDL